MATSEVAPAEMIERIAALVQEIERLNCTGSLVFNDVANKAIQDKLAALDKSAGPGLHPGRILRFPAADGYALYIVREVKPRTVLVEHVALGDAYRAPYTVRNGKVSRAVAAENIRRTDAYRQIFGGK